jgi:deoxyuridine 5'-triphosphate nucleotidohydrolase
MNSPPPTDVFRFVHLTNHALPAVPTPTTLDVRSAYTAIIPAHKTRLIATDIPVIIPGGIYIQVTSRSGLGLKQYIDILDHTYIGNTGVLLQNQSEDPFVVQRGDIVAHITFHKVYHPHIEEVDRLTVT